MNIGRDNSTVSLFGVEWTKGLEKTLSLIQFIIQISLDDEFGPGTLRRAHSEELMSEVGLSRDDLVSDKKVSAKKFDKNVEKVPENDDERSLQSLRVSDRPVAQQRRRQRHNSAESAAEMSKKFSHCPEYADFYTGQVITHFFNPRT